MSSYNLTTVDTLNMNSTFIRTSPLDHAPMRMRRSCRGRRGRRGRRGSGSCTGIIIDSVVGSVGGRVVLPI